jgi:hypothetical protein
MMERGRKPKGNPNPSPETRFTVGKRANPNGKTSAQKKAEMQAGEIAAQIQAKLLAHLAEQDPATMAESLSGSDLMKLIKDAMDRQFGTATQKVEASGKDGGPIIIQWRNADG